MHRRTKKRYEEEKKDRERKAPPTADVVTIPATNVSNLKSVCASDSI